MKQPALGESRDVALDIAREGAVLLQNDGLLPLNKDAGRIAVFGCHADRGVLSGGGSSQVTPTGGPAPRRRLTTLISSKCSTPLRRSTPCGANSLTRACPMTRAATHRCGARRSRRRCRNRFRLPVDEENKDPPI